MLLLQLHRQLNSLPAIRGEEKEQKAEMERETESEAAKK